MNVEEEGSNNRERSNTIHPSLHADSEVPHLYTSVISVGISHDKNACFRKTMEVSHIPSSPSLSAFQQGPNFLFLPSHHLPTTFPHFHTYNIHFLIQDEHVIVDGFGGTPDQGYFAIYDGHGGRGAVEFTAANLHKVWTRKRGCARKRGVRGVDWFSAAKISSPINNVLRLQNTEKSETYRSDSKSSRYFLSARDPRLFLNYF